jgi:O-antigen/teichoic acid export membrane protein
VGAIITLALNFLLIPTMSYYGSAIATIAAYGSMMSISYYLGNKYYPIPYDLKKIGAISAIHTFSAYPFMVSERTIMWSQFINRVPIFYLSQ